MERRADSGPGDDDPDRGHQDRGRQERGGPEGGQRPDDDPAGTDHDGAADGEGAADIEGAADGEGPCGGDEGAGGPVGAPPAWAAKRPVGGDLRAAGWAVAAIVVATLSIFLAQRLYASTSGQRGSGRPAPTAGRPAPTAGERPGCTASFTVGSAWPTGFQATVTVRATGAAAIDGWTVTWTFPGDQAVMQMWNGHYAQTRSKVTVQSEGWNASPSPKGSTTFGFVGTGAAPTGVQDLRCTVSLATASPSRR